MQLHRTFILLFIFITTTGLIQLTSAETRRAAADPLLTEDLGRNPTHITSDVVIRVTYQNAAEIEPYLVYDLWQDRMTTGSVLLRVTPAEYIVLNQSGLPITIDREQTAILRDAQEAVENSVSRSGIPGFSCYRTVEETYSSFDTLEATYPALVERVDIGDSWDKQTAGGPNGYDLYAWVLTNEALTPVQPKPIFFILAAVHAREYTTAETATRFAEHVLSGYGSDPNITWMLDHYALHIIPQGNPDGRKIAESADTFRRKNTNTASCSTGTSYGVDLNRNASFQWGTNGGSSTSTCSDLYRGTSAGSEPETIAFETYADTILPDQRINNLTASAPLTTTGVFISIHSYWEKILPAWAWFNYYDNPNFAGMNALGRRMAYYNDYEVSGTGDAGIGAASGTHDDFIYGEFGLPSYTLELGTAFHQACATFESTIYPDNLNALLYAYRVAHQPYRYAAGPDIINLTASITSGLSSTTHLQVLPNTIITLKGSADDTRNHSHSSYSSTSWGNTGISSEPIQSAWWSLDNPAWVSGTVTTALTAQDGTFDSTQETLIATIDTSGWTLGKHLVYVQSADNNGTPGAPSAIFIEITNTPLAIQLTSADVGQPAMMWPLIGVTALCLILCGLSWRLTK